MNSTQGRVLILGVAVAAVMNSSSPVLLLVPFLHSGHRAAPGLVEPGQSILSVDSELDGHRLSHDSGFGLFGVETRLFQNWELL